MVRLAFFGRYRREKNGFQTNSTSMLNCLTVIHCPNDMRYKSEQQNRQNARNGCKTMAKRFMGLIHKKQQQHISIYLYICKSVHYREYCHRFTSTFSWNSHSLCTEPFRICNGCCSFSVVAVVHCCPLQNASWHFITNQEAKVGHISNVSVKLFRLFILQ